MTQWPVFTMHGVSVCLIRVCAFEFVCLLYAKSSLSHMHAVLSIYRSIDAKTVNYDVFVAYARSTMIVWRSSKSCSMMPIKL